MLHRFYRTSFISFTFSSDISNLTSTIVKSFNTDGASKLEGLNYLKLPIDLLQNPTDYSNVDLLYKCKALSLNKTPLWSGSMKREFGCREAIAATKIVYLPMIDLPAADLQSVYSGLFTLS